MIPGNPSTDGTSRSRAKKNRKSKKPKGWDNAAQTEGVFTSKSPVNSAQADTDQAAKPLPVQLPNEVWIKILEKADNPNTYLVDRHFSKLSHPAQINLWRQARHRAENAKSDNDAVAKALYQITSILDDLIAPYDDPNLAVRHLDFAFRHFRESSHPDCLEKIAEAFISISNNPESDATDHEFVVRGLGDILKTKDRAPGAARIAAWGLRELTNSPPRPTDYGHIIHGVACRYLESQTSDNEKKCMGDVLDSKTAAQHPPQLASSPRRRPTAQILLSALKRPAKTWKHIQDRRHRGR